MFLEIEEMKTHLYSYQLDEITETDDTITEAAVRAAVSEVRSYFNAANKNLIEQVEPTYDVDAIFGATGDDRNQFVLKLCKDLAAWNIIQLSNVDALYSRFETVYKNAITALEKIAGIGYYKNSPVLLMDELPTVDVPTTDGDVPNLPFSIRSKYPVEDHRY